MDEELREWLEAAPESVKATLRLPVPADEPLHGFKLVSRARQPHGILMIGTLLVDWLNSAPSGTLVTDYMMKRAVFEENYDPARLWDMVAGGDGRTYWLRTDGHPILYS